MLLGLPLLPPLFAQGTDQVESMPACCRRSGAHHCQMHMEERAASDKARTQVGALASRCPFCPRAVVAAHVDVMAARAADGLDAALVSHPSCVAQTESKWRIARDRSRQKRGPPSLNS